MKLDTDCRECRRKILIISAAICLHEICFELVSGKGLVLARHLSERHICDATVTPQYFQSIFIAKTHFCRMGNYDWLKFKYKFLKTKMFYTIIFVKLERNWYKSAGSFCRMGHICSATFI